MPTCSVVCGGGGCLGGEGNWLKVGLNIYKKLKKRLLEKRSSEELFITFKGVINQKLDS